MNRFVTKKRYFEIKLCIFFFSITKWLLTSMCISKGNMYLFYQSNPIKNYINASLFFNNSILLAVND